MFFDVMFSVFLVSEIIREKSEYSFNTYNVIAKLPRSEFRAMIILSRGLSAGRLIALAVSGVGQIRKHLSSSLPYDLMGGF